MTGTIRVGVAWFPADQFQHALTRWPELAGSWETRDYAVYCRTLEKLMTELTGHADPVLVPVQISTLDTWSAAHHLDPGSREARSQYAADLARRPGVGPAWPPGAEAPCWCGSGTVYRACCRAGTAFRKASGPG